MAQGWGTRRLRAFVGLAALLVYTAWIGAPYLRSVVMRDAAVTTWINTAASPIDGFLGGKPLHVGDSAEKDGLIATIQNPLQDATPVVRCALRSLPISGCWRWLFLSACWAAR